MPKRRNLPDSSRRNFLKGAGLVGAAAAVTPPVTANAIPAAPQERLKAAVPGPLQIAAETMPPTNDPVNQTSSGGDFMTDVLNSLGIEYLAINCASSYRGLHEAVINHANNKPEIITCVHEDIAVHMAQGYAKIEGKPIAMACHGVVGLQHATMAMYNAWCDRVPVIVIGGNIMEADKRAPGAEMGAFGRSTSARSCATSPSGTINPPRCSISPSRRCAPTRSRRRRRWGRSSSRSTPSCRRIRSRIRRACISRSSRRSFRRRAIPARSPKRRRCWSRRKIRSSSAIACANAGGDGDTSSNLPKRCNAASSTTPGA